jgi:hypothetical protein
VEIIRSLQQELAANGIMPEFVAHRRFPGFDRYFE